MLRRSVEELAKSSQDGALGTSEKAKRYSERWSKESVESYKTLIPVQRSGWFEFPGTNIHGTDHVDERQGT